MDYKESVEAVLATIQEAVDQNPSLRQRIGNGFLNLGRRAYTAGSAVRTAATIGKGVAGVAALPVTAAAAPWIAAASVGNMMKLQGRLNEVKGSGLTCICGNCAGVMAYINGKVENKSLRAAAKASYIGQPFEAVYTHGKQIYRALNPSTQKKIKNARLLLDGWLKAECLQAIGIMVALSGGPQSQEYMFFGKTSEEVVAGAFLRDDGDYVIKSLMP